MGLNLPVVLGDALQFESDSGGFAHKAEYASFGEAGKPFRCLIPLTPHQTWG
jgi:hypothetical protein